MSAKAQQEAALEAELVRFCQAHLRLLHDPDPETRGQMCLLLGVVGGPDMATALLLRYRDDGDKLAPACALQGLLQILGREPTATDSALAAMLNVLLADASPEVVARANYVIDAVWWTAEQRRQLRRVLVVPDSDRRPSMWPSEGSDRMGIFRCEPTAGPGYLWARRRTTVLGRAAEVAPVDR